MGILDGIGAIREDLVDAITGAGGNRVYLGSGDEEAVPGESDRVFGGSGNDIIEGSESNSKARFYGGEGDDLFSLGTGDRLIGGNGDDSFFVGTGGDNIITGGPGADRFWVATAGTVPDESNVITDFDPIEDAIGAGGFSAGELGFGEENGSGVLSIGGEPVATFLGVS